MTTKNRITHNNRRYCMDNVCSIMNDLTGEDIRRRTRNQELVCARAMVAAVLFTRGCTETMVGDYFGVTHTSAHHYKKKMRLILTAPGYDYERELWEVFNNRLKERI